MNTFLSYLPGIILVLFGIAVALSPEILVVLISSFFIISGIIFLLWAKRFRDLFINSKVNYNKSRVDVYIEK